MLPMKESAFNGKASQTTEKNELALAPPRMVEIRCDLTLGNAHLTEIAIWNVPNL